tara:strand:+ start:187 stop:1335 length:1149 start_codon:yes stop_codon:yes gene_type:complete
MAKINVISPYFINLDTTNLVSAKIEIHIYEGAAHTSWQLTPQYTLTSTAINEKVTFEIAELIKDYIPAEFDGTYPTSLSSANPYDNTTVYVDYRITETLTTGVAAAVVTLGVKAFLGYGYFEDGVNPQLLQGYLQSNTTILKSDDDALRIPVDNEKTTSVAFFNKGEQIYTWTPTAGLKIQDQIQYVSTASASVDNYRERVLASNGIFEDNPCIQEYLRSETIYPVDEVIVNAIEGVTVIKVNNISECKFNPYKLTFINKFGVYQDLWMFKRNSISIAATEEKFKRNILTNGSYNTYSHQNTILTKNAKQSLTLNSGYYPESNNELFKQLILSERVWIEYDNKTLPVLITSNSLGFKTSLNDKLIDYTIQVEFAYQTINNVR